MLIVNPGASALNLDDLIGWAPNAETNCVTTALYSSKRINDLMHVDPDEFNQLILPYCYKRIDNRQPDVVAIGFATSASRTDFRRLLHIFYIDPSGLAYNKAGSTEREPFERGPPKIFENQFSFYFDHMRKALKEDVVGDVENYEFTADARCPLNQYEKNLQKYVREPIFFATRPLMLERFKKKLADLSLTDVLPKEDLVSAAQMLDQRADKLENLIFKIYKKMAVKNKLPLRTSEDLHKMYPLVVEPRDIQKIQEYFYLRLVRKQIRMALGIKELDEVPNSKN